MAITTLSNFGAPTINSIAAQRILSNTVLQNIYQGLIESDGKGVTQRFTTDCSGAEIRFIHVKPVFQKARQIGAAINGGNFPTLVHEGETDSFGLPVLVVLDDPVDIAQVNKDMIPVDLLGQYTKSISDQDTLNINAITLAGKLCATYLADANGSEVNITNVSANDNLAHKIVEANSLLDNGVEDMGVSMFPQDDRCITIKASERPYLINNGVLVIGGANHAYDIQRKGTVDAGATPRKNEDGFIGTIDGVDVHIVSPLVYKTAAEYVGLPKGDINKVIGCVSSAFANVRGIAAPRGIKVIDTPQGQGTRLQPLFRMGFKVVEGYEKGNSFLMDGATFVNPFDGVKTLFGLANLSSFQLLAPTSRITLTPTLVKGASNKFTCTCDGATKIALLCVGAGTTINSVADFVADYNAETGKDLKTNTATSGVATTLAGATAGTMYALCYAPDGTMALTSVFIA